jgi:hypothetical protein
MSRITAARIYEQNRNCRGSSSACTNIKSFRSKRRGAFTDANFDVIGSHLLPPFDISLTLKVVMAGNGWREFGGIVGGIRADGGFALWRQLKFDEAGHR